MARKRKFKLIDSITIEYNDESDLLLLQYIMLQARKQERHEHHVAFYEEYDNFIKTIDDELKRG